MSLPEFLFSRVAADIRQQMEGVLALAERLNRQRLPPEAQACAAGIEEAAQGVRRLLDGALELRTTVSHGPNFETAPVRLRELMDEVQARWGARAAAGEAALLVSYDGDPDATVLGDRSRLLQIFDGFIAEAAGGQRQGAVEASLQASVLTDGVRLQGRIRGVRDATWETQDLEARIRDIDARLGLEVALGAMLARRLVQRMGGEPRIEAGAGTAQTLTFDLTLPRLVEAPEPTEAPQRSAHVLVVDDNATNRMVAQSLVEMFDCTSEAAEDGAQAVEAARSGRFDLILMDIRMPNMDGVAATRAIRALPGRTGETPIIALTANADAEDAAGYIAAGMNGVVEKPMKPEHLLNALKDALGESEGAGRC